MKFSLMLYKTEEMGGGERVIANIGKIVKQPSVIAFSTKECYSKNKLINLIKKKFKIELRINKYECIQLNISKLIKNKYKEVVALHKFLNNLGNEEIGVVHLSDVHKIVNKSKNKIIYFVGPGPNLKMNLISNIIKKIYFYPYNLFLKAKKVNSNVIVVPVSNSIKEKLEKRGIKTYKVIYPPVNVKDFIWKGEKKKKNRIIYFSRISRDKKQDLVLEVARKLPEYEFVIAGSVSDEKYLDELKRNAPKNVKILTDLPLKELVKITRSSNFYVHMAENDTMPATVIEAMAAGCIPIVHKSGGPWIDVIEKGRYGLDWNEIDDIVKIIKRTKVNSEMRKKIVERSKKFSNGVFEREIKIILFKIRSKEL